MARRARNPSLVAIRRTIETSVIAAVAKAVPEALHAEFLQMGLATKDEENLLAAQKDFAWLRAARMAADAAERYIGRQVLKWTVGTLGGAALIGLGALARGAVVHGN